MYSVLPVTKSIYIRSAEGLDELIKGNKKREGVAFFLKGCWKKLPAKPSAAFSGD